MLHELPSSNHTLPMIKNIAYLCASSKNLKGIKYVCPPQVICNALCMCIYVLCNFIPCVSKSVECVAWVYGPPIKHVETITFSGSDSHVRYWWCVLQYLDVHARIFAPCPTKWQRDLRPCLGMFEAALPLGHFWRKQDQSRVIFHFVGLVAFTDFQ